MATTLRTLVASRRADVPARACYVRFRKPSASLETAASPPTPPPMASLRPDLVVSLTASSSSSTFVRKPTGTGVLVVAVHGAALKARGNRLTQLVEIDGEVVRWAGAVDERSVSVVPGAPKRAGARALLAAKLFRGPRCFQLIEPGPLRASNEAENEAIVDAVWPLRSTWLVLGDDPTAGLLAMPIGTTGKEARWAHAIAPTALPPAVTAASPAGLALLESNHLWSFSPMQPATGELGKKERSALERAVRSYWR
jgi:hypothetical protein